MLPLFFLRAIRWASSRSITRKPGEAFLFASEVRALLASGCVPPQLAAEAVPSYLLFGSVCEPDDHGARRLLAAARPLAENPCG